MSDELKDRDLLKRGTGNSSELTTADLAGVGLQKEKQLEMESDRQEMSARNQPLAAESTRGGAAAARAKAEDDLGPLFSSDEANKLQSTWDSVQVAFVDEPRQAVEDADRLIASTMKRLAEVFAEERQKLEHQWDRGDNVSTEDLRLALRRYRSFFSRLLKV